MNSRRWAGARHRVGSSTFSAVSHIWACPDVSGCNSRRVYHADLRVPRPPSRFQCWMPFKQVFERSGWAQSDTFMVKSRFAAGQFQKIPEYVTELARLDVKAIYVLGSQAAALVKQETTIPVVMIGDPIGAQLAANSDRPGGTVTGLAGDSLSQEICGKRLKLLKDVAPDLTRVAFAANPEHPATPNVLRMTRAAAEMLRIDLIPVDVRSEKDMEDAFDMMAKAREPRLLFFTPSPCQMTASASWQSWPCNAGFFGQMRYHGM